MPSNPSPHEIVILGGNFAGVNAVHHLLRQTLPQLQRLDQSKSYHITLVTPNTSFFFKIASPRALINSTLIPQEKIFRPLSEAFSQYDASQFELIQGTASALDPAKRSVTVSIDETGDTQQIHYDSLIISTGTTSKSPLWGLHGNESITKKALESLNTTLPNAKTVLIAGGGPVGVETAGEIASNYPNCKVTLLSGANRLLPRIKEATSVRAQDYLENMRVEVIHNVRVASTNPAQPDASPATLELSDGSSREVDIYIDATGGSANSQFLPKTWLDETGRVITRDAYFRVKGAGSDDVKGIYALGDIVAGSSNLAMEVDPMITTLSSSLAVDISGDLDIKKPAAPASGYLASLLKMFLGGSDGYPVQQEFKPLKETIFVPIGSAGGVGQLMGWRVPSLLVKIGKGKSYFVELIGPIMSGEKWKKA
ncbi:1fc6dfa0-e0d6-4a38-b66d-f0ab69245977-CDS [Sclerotinia trifoliorum]|uniref:1fc6dfa0-e0d6-4a38-b66d-f0ab69245977-CDS n=1 Tax=Sclerotinia trifoliorum TaxID=28548 RepID=A0A8H2ZR12_9HELO|nr:1fc6dfa0-e0d6-4a38-b66d-f0ab69245977-CDS [Sclerotinia trifoliorum]